MRNLLVLVLLAPVLVSSVAVPSSSDVEWVEETWSNEEVEAQSGIDKTSFI